MAYVRLEEYLALNEGQIAVLRAVPLVTPPATGFLSVSAIHQSMADSKGNIRYAEKTVQKYLGQLLRQKLIIKIEDKPHYGKIQRIFAG